MVHPEILLSFTHPHAFQNLHDFLVEWKAKGVIYSWQSIAALFYTMKVNGDQICQARFQIIGQISATLINLILFEISKI